MNKNLKTALIMGGIIVAVLIILSIVLDFLWGWQMGGFDMMGRGMMGGFGTMFLMPILWIVILGLIIWAVVEALHRTDGLDSIAHKTDSPMEIFKRMYAQGEIDKEEYEIKKKDLV